MDFIERSEQQTPKWEEIHGLEMGQSCNLNLLNDPKNHKKAHPPISPWNSLHFPIQTRRGRATITRSARLIPPKFGLIWTLVHCPSLHGQVNRALQGFRWQWGNLQILLENKEMVSYPHNFSTVSGMWWRKRNENNSDGQRSGFNLWNSCFPKTKSIKILSFIDSTSIWNRNSLIVLCFNKQVMFKVTCTNGVKK